LTLYGVTAAADRDRLQTLNRAARERAWWDTYRDRISADYLDYVGYEAGASFIRQFPATVVPGLLQTAEYAEVLTATTVEDPKQIAAVVDLRLQRQSQLAQRSNPPRQFYVVDEAVIRRHVGIKTDPSIMPNQLRHMADRAAGDELITIRVIPFAAGAHAGLSGAFTLLELEGDLPDLLYLDAGRGTIALIPDGDAQFTEYRDNFELLLESSLPEDESIDFMRRAAEEMGRRSIETPESQ
jgi:hypothetical protein